MVSIMGFYHKALKIYTNVRRGGSKIHNMTWQMALKSFLSVSDNPQINVLAGASS